MSFYTVLAAGSPTGNPIVAFPKVNQTFQRNSSSQASFTVSGTAPYPFTSVQVRAVSIANGTTTGWTTIHTSATPIVGAWSGTFSNVAQGWYRLDVRTNYFVSTNGNTSVPTFGVGEIIIPCGQSLYCGANEGLTSSTDPRALTVDLNGNYSKCADPLPIQTGITASLWPTVADLLVTHLNLPVVIACTGIGGQTVANWQPGGADYNLTLLPTLRLFPANGFRTLIWGQGETDMTDGTSTANYQGTAGVNGLRNIISQSRLDAGWTIPWGINLESSDDGVNVDASITTAQANVIGDSNNYQVINMDSFMGADRWASAQPHISTTGLAVIGSAISTALITKFGW